MNWFLMIIVVMVSAALQVMIPAVVSLGHAKFPILLSVVLYYALHQDSTEMFVAAFLAGLVQDLLSMPPPGYSCLVFCVMGLIASRFRKIVQADEVITSAFFGALSAMGFCLGMQLLLLQGELVSLSFGSFFLKTIGWGLLALVTTPIVFLIMVRMELIVGIVESKEVVLDESLE